MSFTLASGPLLKDITVSDSPPQTGTGMNSAESPPKSLNQRAVELAGKLRALPEIVGWESIRRGMKAEDDAVKRNLDAYHNLLFNGRESDQKGESDEMGNIILGDYRIEQHLPQPAQPSKKSGGLVKTLLGAGLLATGIGGPLGAFILADRLKPDPPAVVQPEPVEPIEKIIDNSKTFDWRVGEPIIE